MWIRSSVAATSLLVLNGTTLAAQCPDGSPAPCGPAVPGHSIAVLSFQSRSRDSADVYLAEGLSDDIASRLGQVRRLTVRSRELVRRTRNANAMTVPELGRSLRVTYVLSGSVRPADGRLHLVFELTHAPSGRVAWTQGYERSRDALLQLQATVAGHVAESVLGRLTPPERAQLAAASTRSEKAFSHIARGTAFLARRLMPAAMSELQAAVAADAGSAVAWAALAQTYSLCAWLGPQSAAPCPVRGDSLRPLAIAAASRAVTLDSMLADAWLADALTRTVSPVGLPDYPRGLASLRRAEALGGRGAELLHTIGSVLLIMGVDDTQAIRYLRSALASDPGRGVTYIYLSRAAWVQGRFADALTLLDTAQSLEPHWDVRADRWRAHLALGDTTQLIGAWSRLSAGRGSQPADTSLATERRLIETGLVRLRAGDSSVARAVADTLVALRSRDPWTALMLTRLGRGREASGVVSAFSPSVATSYLGLRSPAFAELLAVPEFRAHLERERRSVTTSGQGGSM